MYRTNKTRGKVQSEETPFEELGVESMNQALQNLRRLARVVMHDSEWQVGGFLRTMGSHSGGLRQRGT